MIRKILILIPFVLCFLVTNSFADYSRKDITSGAMMYGVKGMLVSKTGMPMVLNNMNHISTMDPATLEVTRTIEIPLAEGVSTGTRRFLAQLPSGDLVTLVENDLLRNAGYWRGYRHTFNIAIEVIDKDTFQLKSSKTIFENVEAHTIRDRIKGMAVNPKGDIFISAKEKASFGYIDRDKLYRFSPDGTQLDCSNSHAHQCGSLAFTSTDELISVVSGNQVRIGSSITISPELGDILSLSVGSDGRITVSGNDGIAIYNQAGSLIERWSDKVRNRIGLEFNNMLLTFPPYIF